MEKQFNREEEFLRKLLNQAGTEKPSADFKSKIMMRIQAAKAPVKAYKPLISASVWYVVAIALVLAVGGLYFQFPGISIDFSGNFDYLKLKTFEVNLPNLQFPRTMLYAVAFMALFFLQIPFLKRIIDKQGEA